MGSQIMKVSNYVVHYTAVLSEKTNEQVLKEFLSTLSQEVNADSTGDYQDFVAQMKSVDTKLDIEEYTFKLLYILIHATGDDGAEDVFVDIVQDKGVYVLIATYIISS